MKMLMFLINLQQQECMKWIKTVFKNVKTNSKQIKKQKQFGYLIVGLTLLYLGISVYMKGVVYDNKQIIAMLIMVAFVSITTIATKFIYPLLFIWLSIGEILGAITSTIVFIVVYYLLFTPISLILNLTKKKEHYRPQWFSRTEKDTMHYENLN